MEWAVGLLVIAGAGAGLAAVVSSRPWEDPTPEPVPEPEPEALEVEPVEPVEPEPEPAENVLVVVVDGLGVDRLGLYGAEHAPITPHIDDLARRGLLFDDASASTGRLHAELLTGRLARRVSAADVFLPEMLERSPHTYASSAVGSWRVAGFHTLAPATHPLQQGFGWFAGAIGDPSGRDGPVGSYRWERTLDDDVAVSEVYATTSTATDAVARLEAMPEPWLLWVGFTAPPSLSGATSFGTLRLITRLDAQIGRVLDAMGDELAGRTTVVLAGDTTGSGTQFPLVVAGPRVGAPGTATAASVRAIDVFPTVAELAEVELDTLELQVDGRSFDEVLAGSAARPVAPEVVEPEVVPEPAVAPEPEVVSEPEGAAP